jgi:glycogen debranching enzyme
VSREEGTAGDGDRVLVDRGTFALLGRDGSVTGRRGATPDGLFVDDARHLSRWRITADDRPLTVLTAGGGTAVCVVPATRDEPSPFTVTRDQAVASGVLAERLTVLNNLPRPVTVVLGLDVDADFADQFELRSDGRTYAKPGAERGTEIGTLAAGGAGVTFHYRRPGGWSAATSVSCDPPPDAIAEPDPGTGCVLTWRLRLPAHGASRIDLTVRATPGGRTVPAGGPARPQMLTSAQPSRAASPPAAVRADLAADAAAYADGFALPAHGGTPGAAPGLPGLEKSVRRGIADLAALRVPAAGPDGEPLLVPGAGAPWFLTLFGRDSLLTSLFCLPYRPATAADTLLALAAAQGSARVAARLEEPGRIPHELRRGELAHFGQVPYGRYYGSVDATALFLVLLQAYTERTGDTALARRLEPHARAAVAWMFADGGIDDHGWLVYRSDEQAGGLANQNWKDSAGAVCFADGRQATGAIAVAEAQGYAHDALRRTAALAEEVWADPEWARSLRHAAADLRRRFPEEFWLSAADFPALALDGERQRVDALASDAGHLLWSGILDPDRARRVARRLLEPDFFSGWGIRTLAAGQIPYHPLAYHRGAVWPHDNAVIALGMAAQGLRSEARTVAEGLVAAARARGWRLPEVISGYGLEVHPEPVPYPHSCSPQAWAAATPLALLTAVGPRPAGSAG